MKLNDYLKCQFPFGVCDFNKIENLINCRNKSNIPENAKSIIMFAFPYLVKIQNNNLSKYAIVSDYHTVLKQKLCEIAELLNKQIKRKFIPFIDNSPLPEVYCAKMCGLGFVGKNSLLITPEYGSYVFLGAIITDVDFEKSQPNTDRCFGCDLCIKACPGGAISDNGIDVKKCVSAINQKKGELTQDEIDMIKKAGLIWGCDCCQDACPHNKNAKLTYIEDFKNNVISSICYDDIDELIRTRAFGFRGADVVKRNYKILYDK